MNVLDKLGLELRLKSLEKKSELTRSGFDKLDAAKTPEDYKNALKTIAGSWNA